MNVLLQNTEVSLVEQLRSYITRYEWETEKKPMIEERDIDHDAEDDKEDDVPGPDQEENDV